MLRPHQKRRVQSAWLGVAALAAACAGCQAYDRNQLLGDARVDGGPHADVAMPLDDVRGCDDATGDCAARPDAAALDVADAADRDVTDVATLDVADVATPPDVTPTQEVCCSAAEGTACAAACPRAMVVESIVSVRYGAQQCGNLPQCTGRPLGARCTTAPDCLGKPQCAFRFDNTACGDPCMFAAKTGVLVVRCAPGP